MPMAEEPPRMQTRRASGGGDLRATMGGGALAVRAGKNRYMKNWLSIQAGWPSEEPSTRKRVERPGRKW